MKFIKLTLASATALLLAPSAFGLIPVMISEPSPAIPSTLTAFNATSYVYTITNNLNKAISLSTPVLPSNAKINADLTTCTASLAAKTPCAVGITITPQASDIGKTINQAISINYQGRGPLVKKITFKVNGISQVATGISYDKDGNGYPLAIVSRDNGATWNNESTNPTPAQGLSGINSSACTNDANSQFCIIAGMMLLPNEAQNYIVTNANSATTWSNLNLSSILDQTTLSYPLFGPVSCIGSGKTASCMILNNTVEIPPFLIIGTNGGVSWQNHSLATLFPQNAGFASLSCAGSNSSPVCIAVGSSVSPEAAVALKINNLTDPASWQNISSAINFASSAAPLSVSCTDSEASSATCLIAGSSAADGTAAVSISTNGGTTWTPISSSTFAKPTALSANPLSASCTGSAENTVCAIAGFYNYLSSQSALLFVSTDKGVTWQDKSSLFSTNFTALNTVNCSGSGTTATCIAVGSSTAGPLLAVSQDGGITWNLPTIKGLPTGTGSLVSVSCNNNTVCVASGAMGDRYQPSAQPLLVASYDGAKTWQKISTIANQPANGVFYGITSATANKGYVSFAPALHNYMSQGFKITYPK